MKENIRKMTHFPPNSSVLSRLVRICYMNTRCSSSVQLVCYTNPHSNKQLLIPGWSKYPTVPCNGTSRRSLIGSDHRTSLRDDCQLHAVSSRRALRRWVASHHFVLWWKLFLIATGNWNKRSDNLFFFSQHFIDFFSPSHTNIYTTYTCSSEWTDITDK